jgi:exopolysaccharide biosynthesis polyprenyl glycosylphosphotransferase
MNGFAPTNSAARGPWPFARLTPRLLQSVALGVALLVASSLLGTSVASEEGLATVLAAAGLLLSLPLAWSAALFTRRLFPTRTLIVGTGALARKIVEEISRRQHGPDLIVGIADDVSGPIDPSFRGVVTGPLARLGALIQEVRPDRIVVALADRRGRLPMRELLDARVRGVAVEDAVDLYERLTGKLAIESLNPSNLIASRDFRKSPRDLAPGHVASIVGSAIALVMLAPLMALVAVAVKLDSPGPVFFVQDRVGLGGRRFRLIKFRTMRPAKGKTSEWASDNGDRVTVIGQWLRKFRLDELPQLINVIRGEMNLVGPRPHPVSNFELFRENIPYYSLRAVIRPGLTGWAQVRQGYANGLEEETEKMRYDLYYIKHMSAWLDLRILVKTIKTVLCGRESIPARQPSGVITAVGGELRLVRVEQAETDRRPVKPSPPHQLTA